MTVRRVAPLLLLLLLAAAPRAQPSTERFDLTEANLAIFGLAVTFDYVAPPNGQHLEARAHLEYTSTGLDAAQLLFQFQAPSTGVPVWSFTGADLGWSGTGSFSADVSTQVLDGAIDLGLPPPTFSLYGLTLNTTSGAPLSGSFSDSYFEVDIDPWADLGQSLAPLAGSAPVFDPDGTLAPASALQLDLAGAPSLATTVLVVSTARIDAPFKQGVLVPAPDMLFTRVADAAGAVQLDLTWPAGVPGGVPLHLQWWVVDASGLSGFTASRAFKAVTP